MKTQETTTKREKKDESKPVVLNRNNLKCHVSTTAHGFGTCQAFVNNLTTKESCFIDIRPAQKEVSMIVSETKVVQTSHYERPLYTDTSLLQTVCFVLWERKPLHSI